jgi:cation-transporting ATPase 13A1
MLIDFAGCYVVETGCKYFFASLEPMEMITRGRERREKRRKAEDAAKGIAGAVPQVSLAEKKVQ